MLSDCLSDYLAYRHTGRKRRKGALEDYLHLGRMARKTFLDIA